MTRNAINFFLFAIAIFGNSNLFGQSIPEKLDSYFVSSPNPINGNVLVAENGQVIYKKSFGFANIKNKIPNSESSRFNIASISKTFTAVAVLQLKEKGKVNIDEPVKKYLPEFPFADITVRHLLSHTSGLPDGELFNDIGGERIITNQDLLPNLNKWKEPLPFKPGEKLEYSNVNFNLLALIIEKVSGRKFVDYLQANIFSKAEMLDTYILEDILHRRQDKNRVINHELLKLYAETPIDFENKLFPYYMIAYRSSGLKGSTDIVTTANDLLKYDQSLYSGVLLKQSTLDEALTPTKLNNGEPANFDIGIGKAAYGLGWFIFDDASKGKVVWHTGGEPGTLSIFLRNISKNQTVVLLDNASSDGWYENGVNVMHILNNTTPLLIEKRSIVREYGRDLVTKGIDSAFSKLIELKADTVNYYLNEDEMNQMGYDLFADTEIVGHQEKALEVFKLNTLLFPKGFNTFDSYGEHLAKIGKKDEAILMYKESLELNPESETGKKALEELLKIAVSAQTLNEESLKQIDKIMERYKPTNPGCQLSISQKGKVVFSKAYGMADLERRVPLTTESPIEAASVAKQFTAAAVLLLEQQGKLSLQDDVRKYLPEMPNYGVPITLGHMMRHTSGLRDWLMIAAISGWGHTTKTFSLNDVLEIMMRQKSVNFTPGETHAYSNSNYNLLAIVVEKASGMNLAEFTKKHIFEPAGMTHTQWRESFKKIVPNRAIAYAKGEDGYQAEMPYNYAYGDSGLLTTTEDLLKWNAFYLSGKFGSPSLLEKQTLLVPFNNGKTGNYAAGLYVHPIRGWKSIFHDGGTVGYRASLEHFPEADLSFAFLSNTNEFDDVQPVYQLVRNLFIPNKNVPPRNVPPTEPEVKAIKLSAEQLKKYEGWYREDGWKGGMSLKLTPNDGKLAISRGGTMAPVAEDTFMNGSNKVQFLESGKKMVVYFPEETLTFYAAENPVINEKSLTEYSGVYYSEETESKASFAAKDGKLFASVKLNEEIEVKPLYKDRFHSPLGEIQFVRDDKEQIAGFEVSNNRLVGIKFEKIVKNP